MWNINWCVPSSTVMTDNSILETLEVSKLSCFATEKADLKLKIVPSHFPPLQFLRNVIKSHIFLVSVVCLPPNKALTP